MSSKVLIAHYTVLRALINVMDDFLNFKDSNCPIQILLDLSAALDTLDHSILKKRLVVLRN